MEEKVQNTMFLVIDLGVLTTEIDNVPRRSRAKLCALIDVKTPLSTVKTPNSEAVLQADTFNPTDEGELSVAVLPCDAYFPSCLQTQVCLGACFEAIHYSRGTTLMNSQTPVDSEKGISSLYGTQGSEGISKAPKGHFGCVYHRLMNRV